MHSRDVSAATHTSAVGLGIDETPPLPSNPIISLPQPSESTPPLRQSGFRPSPPTYQPTGLSRKASLGSRRGPGHTVAQDRHDGAPEHTLTTGQTFLPPIADIDDSLSIQHDYDATDEEDDDDDAHSRFSFDEDDSPQLAMPGAIRSKHRNRDSDTLGDEGHQWPLSPTVGSPSQPPTPDATTGLFPPPRIFSDHSGPPSPNRSTLSLHSVVGERTDYKLQKVDPFFTDSTGAFYHAFEDKLKTLNGKNSETSNCIEEFLVKSEKEWFNTFRNAKLGRLKKDNESLYSVRRSTKSRPQSIHESLHNEDAFEMTESSNDADSQVDEFLLGADYKPPTGLRKWMQIRIGDWPLYAFFLALGQIMAANSYQITLLTGEIGQTSSKLYVVASIYLATSACWWILFRRFASVLSLSLPFFFYGLAFVLLGCSPFTTGASREWIQNVATGSYAIASSSGALYFSLNFGDEGGAQIKAWVFRACVIQGTQQIYIVALWLWGSLVSRQIADGVVTTQSDVIGTWKVTAIAMPIAIILWVIGVALWLGLPSYYRQKPGKMPSFYRAAVKRKVVIWFFVTVVIQNFFLSAPYGRNWSFLFSSQHAKPWQVLLLVVLFFIGVWIAFLAIFAQLSKSHSWILPLFAIGLLAPRWAQIW